jgi:hypothetical protein
VLMVVGSTRLVSLLLEAIAFDGSRDAVMRLLLLVFASFFGKGKGVFAAFFGVVVEKAVWEV